MVIIESFQEAVNASLFNVCPEDFELNLLFVTVVPSTPPPGFEDSWAVFDSGAEDKFNAAWMAPANLRAYAAIVMYVDLRSEAQSAHGREVLQYLDESDDAVDDMFPPVLCIRVAPYDLDQPGMDEQAEMQQFEERASQLLLVGARSLIDDHIHGPALVVALQIAIREILAGMEQLESSAGQLGCEIQYRDFIRASIQETLWEYLRHRITTAIPPMNPALFLEGTEQVGGYMLGRRLGAGRTGTVYEATPPPAQADEGVQALKVVCKSTVRGLSDLKWLNRGLEVMELLKDEWARHPNIVRLQGVFHTYDHIIIRMEHGGAETLFERLGDRDAGGPDGRPLPPLLLHSVAKQVIEPVRHLHTAMSICHRDLKPRNYVVSHPSHDSIALKLVDFDLAMVQQPGRCACSKCGTFPFIAPEVVLGQEYDGIQADVWGVGMIMLELMCGKRIFETACNIECPRGTEPNSSIMDQIVELFTDEGLVGRILEEHSVTDGIPLRAGIQDAIRPMMDTNPTTRIRSDRAAQLIASIQPALGTL